MRSALMAAALLAAAVANGAVHCPVNFVNIHMK